MSVKIITGRSKSGKSKYIYDEISKLVLSGRKAVLIVPEQFSHAAEKRLLSVVDAIHESGAEVFSFEHLSTVLEKRMGYPQKAKLNSVSKALVVRDILINNTFSFYTDACRKNGFSDMISSLISEFKKYGITPDILDDIKEKTDNELLKLKLDDLTIIYKQYEESIEKKCCDSEDSLTLLTQRIVNSDYFNDKYVFIDEFSTFVPQEINVIKAISDRSEDTYITLCCDISEKNTTLFMPTIDTIKKLKNVSKSEVLIKKLDNTYFSSPELKHLEKNLFSYSADKYSGKTENIHVSAFSNPLSEVENCVAEIKRLIREDGYMYRDIGIICSDTDTYIPHIDRVFEHAQIEYFADKKDDVINHHLIRFVLGILEIYTSDYSYESIFNFLKACVIDVEPGDISILRKFMKKRDIRKSTWINDDKWNEALTACYSDDTASYETADNIRKKYIIPLAMMHENIKGRKLIKDTAMTFYDYLTSINMPRTITSYIDRFNDEGELRYAKEYEKIWQIITNTLDEIVDICGDKKSSPAEFYELLKTAFSQQKVGFIPSAVDRVHIGNTERTRLDGIKALFVLGVNENIFPMPQKPDGVLGDTDKEAMGVCGFEFSTTSSVASYYSQFCSYNVFTMPSHKLYISYSKVGNDFKTLRKSYIIERICKIVNIKEISECSLNDEHYIHSSGPLKEKLCSKMSDYFSGNDINSVWKSVYSYYSERTDFINRIKSFVESQNIASTISEENLRILLPILSHTSVSKIERYMACRYAFFIDYILNISVEEDGPVNALELGNVAHAVLEKLSKEYGLSRESFEKCTDEEILSKTDMYIREHISEFSKSGYELSKKDEYQLLRLKNSIFISFLAVKRQILESKFEPLGYEIEFNRYSDIGEIIVKSDDGRDVTLTGKIDRADICRTNEGSYIRVIDYKTGQKEFKFDEVLYGLSVQLLVYLNKLVSTGNDYHHGGAMYFPVKDITINSNGKITPEKYRNELESAFKLKGVVPFDDKILGMYDEKIAASLKHGSSKDKRLTPQEFIITEKYLSKKIASICGDILRGKFDISPSMKNDKTPCEYCEYNTICRFNPIDGNDEYTRYKSMKNYSDIIKEMEAAMNVDKESGDSN